VTGSRPYRLISRPSSPPTEAPSRAHPAGCHLARSAGHGLAAEEVDGEALGVVAVGDGGEPSSASHTVRVLEPPRPPLQRRTTHQPDPALMKEPDWHGCQPPYPTALSSSPRRSGAVRRPGPGSRGVETSGPAGDALSPPTQLAEAPAPMASRPVPASISTRRGFTFSATGTVTVSTPCS